MGKRVCVGPNPDIDKSNDDHFFCRDFRRDRHPRRQWIFLGNVTGCRSLHGFRAVVVSVKWGRESVALAPECEALAVGESNFGNYSCCFWDDRRGKPASIAGLGVSTQGLDLPVNLGGLFVFQIH